MQTIRGLVFFGVVVFHLMWPGPATAASDDRTLSPYFAVEGAEPGVESLPLEDTKARVNIAGVIADVVVTQRYRNSGNKPINARYVFPASTRAAVYGMEMKVANRVIKAKIRERAKAREEYEQAKKEGKSASLLEQDRPNVFSMEVANILPGERIEVELRYTELIVPTAGVYEFVYPTVVGPRYAGGVDGRAPENQFIASGYQHAGQSPSYGFDIDVRVAAGVPVLDLTSPSHGIQQRTQAGGAASVELAAAERSGGNRDFVLRYRLAGKEIASGLMLYPGVDENFFLMMVQPPRRPAPSAIVPREYVFIVDVSGSMHGFPLDVTSELMRGLLGNLRPSDRFNVLLFAGNSELMAPASVAATSSNIAAATSLIQRQSGGGGTELLPALDRALSLPEEEGFSRTFVVVTDGYIGAEREMFERVRDSLGRANVFTFGIGSGVNRYLVEGLAKAGMGAPFVAQSADEAATVSRDLRRYVESPVLTNIKARYDGFEVYDLHAQEIPDVFAERPVVVYGKYRGAPKGTIELSGVSGRGRFVHSFDVGTVKPNSSNRALAQLWARSRIAEISDFASGALSEEEERAVTDLGLKYSLLTKFTSFVAVHHVVRNAAGAAVDVEQPLPMPQGVSDSAIGGMDAGPEPELIWLLLMVLMLAGVAWRRRRGHEIGWH